MEEREDSHACDDLMIVTGYEASERVVAYLREMGSLRIDVRQHES